MKKQDIIRIINEEVDIALDEMIDPIYNSNLPEIVASLIVSGVTIKQIIKFILEKYKNTKNGDKLDKDTIVEIIKKAKSKLDESLEATNKEIVKYKGEDHVITRKSGDRIYLRRAEDAVILGKMPEFWVKAVDIKESINENEEVYNVIDRETEKLITDTPLKKSLALKLAAKKKDGKWIIQKHKESINENEGMKKSLKDIDPSLSLTTYGTKPPSFKITYRVKDDMSKEMEEELVAWVLSKGGRVDSVETMFDVEDGERYYYPYVKFSYK